MQFNSTGDRVIIVGQKPQDRTADSYSARRREQERQERERQNSFVNKLRAEGFENQYLNLSGSSVIAYRRRAISNSDAMNFQPRSVYYGKKVTVPQMRRCNRFLPDGRTDCFTLEGVLTRVRIPLKVYTPDDDSLEKRYAIKFKICGSKAAIYYPEVHVLVFGDVHVSMLPLAFEKIMAYLKTQAPVKAFGFVRDTAQVQQAPQAAAAQQPEPSITFTEFHKGERRLVPFAGEYKRCTVGCDPEFEIVRKDASNRLTAVPPSRRLYGGTGMTERLGVDGAGCQIEVRPRGLDTAGAVVIDMRNIMRDIHDSITTIGNRYPLGGHIHIGVGQEYAPTTDLRWLLDYFVGRPTLKLSGTARSAYRQYGTYETKRWGFEYRTPPAAIFTWPTFARLAMKAAQKITECYINGRTIEVSKPAMVTPTGVANDTFCIPSKEDYMNYCDFSEHEYDAWVAYITEDYPHFASTDGYRANINNFWLNYKKRTADEQIPLAIEEEQRRMGGQRPSQQTYPSYDEMRQRLERHRAAEAARQEDASNRGIVFASSDTFSESARTQLIETLSPVIAELRQSLNNPNFSVYVYGLREARGRVISGFTHPGYETIESTIGTVGNHTIGLPFATRLNPDPEFPSMLTEIARAIREAAAQRHESE